MTTEELFAQARKEHGEKIHAVVLKLIPPQDHEDLEQTIWASIWAALRRFDGRSSLGTYIYPITRRRIADYFRGRYRWMKLLAEIKGNLSDAPADLPASEPFELSTVLLTPAEIGVLRLLADVMPNEEIARTLFVSLNTVRTHVKHIYRKMKISNRGDLILFARRFWKKEET